MAGTGLIGEGSTEEVGPGYKVGFEQPQGEMGSTEKG